MSNVADSGEVRGLGVHQTVTSPTMPAVTAGRFAVRNDGGQQLRIAVASVTVAGEDTAHEVEEYFVYLLPDYQEVPAGGIEVAPGTDASFEVSFAQRPLEPGMSHDVAVVIDVDLGDSRRRVRSPWTWTIRTPRR